RVRSAAGSLGRPDARTSVPPLVALTAIGCRCVRRTRSATRMLRSAAPFEANGCVLRIGEGSFGPVLAPFPAEGATDAGDRSVHGRTWSDACSDRIAMAF